MAVIDDLFPTPLDQFTSDTLEQLRADGKCESLYLELKSEWKPDDVTRCVAAFANADGGFLVFGADQTAGGCINVYPGLEPGVEYPTLAKDRIVGHISPLPVWNAVSVDSPDNPARPVLLIRVGRSERTPHVVTTSGKIYLRTPNACDPVRDRGTIDTLVDRGQGGQMAVEGRWSDLLATPWETGPREEPSWTMVIAAIPSPSVGSAFARMMTRTGHHDFADSLATDAGPPRLTRLLEDGLLCHQGLAEVAIHVDGSIIYRLVQREEAIPGRPRMVPADSVESIVEVALRGLGRLSPPVHQATIRVRLEGTTGFRVGRREHYGFWNVSEWTLAGDWTFTTESGTEEQAAKATAGAIGRRLRRSAGESAFEPE